MKKPEALALAAEMMAIFIEKGVYFDVTYRYRPDVKIILFEKASIKITDN